MERVRNNLASVIVIALVFVFFSCKENSPTEETEMLNGKKNTRLKSNNLDSNITSDSSKSNFKAGGIESDFDIGEQAQSYCQKSVEYWKFENYITVPGKKVGIWPNNDRWTSVERTSELKEKWGFNYIY